MGSGTVFLHLLGLLVVTVRGQTCQAACKKYCGSTNLTRDGSGGTIVDIAYDQPAEVSTIYTDGKIRAGPACLAVNGRTSTAFMATTWPGTNCIHTAINDFAGWWWVDLGRQYTIANITIYRREHYYKDDNASNPNDNRRMAGLSVLVENETSNQTCHTFPNSSDVTALDALPEEMDITCAPPLTGRKIWLQKHGGDSHVDEYPINICEVQVWACKDGLYGRSCEHNCSGNCRGGVPCDNYDGTCREGCREGYTGAYCSKCGRCRNGVMCDVTTRSCPNGRCEKGWQPPYCDRRCLVGWYGDDCSKRCGQCTNGDVCNSVTGVCPNGCLPGRIGPLCKQDCPDGFYGEGCTYPCGNCTGGAACDKVTAKCPNGCQPGFEPPPFCFILIRQVPDPGLGVGVVAGAAAAAIVVGVLIAGVLVIVIRRSRLMSGSGAMISKSSEPNDIPKTAAAKRSTVPVADDIPKTAAAKRSTVPVAHDIPKTAAAKRSTVPVAHDIPKTAAAKRSTVPVAHDIPKTAAAKRSTVPVAHDIAKTAAAKRSTVPVAHDIPKTAATARPLPELPTGEGSPSQGADNKTPAEAAEEESHFVNEEQEGHYMNVKQENFYDPPQARDQEGATYSQLQVPNMRGFPPRV